jgi:hypothetical protein
LNYTVALDAQSAKFFTESRASDKIIYGPSGNISFSLDGRYALFDAPATFRTLLANYKPVAYNDNYLILARKPELSEPVLREIYSANVKLGDIIPIPVREAA